MRLALIKPSMDGCQTGDALEPLALGILSALTPPEIDRCLHDERLSPIDFDVPTDLVAISCDTYGARRSYQIAAEYRRRGVPVVLGGWHPSMCPEEALGHADAVVVGDAEDTWPRVLADARNGRLQRIYHSDFGALAGLHVDCTLFAGRRYASLHLVEFGRGCCHRCDFCSIHAFYGGRYRQRPVQEVLREIETLPRRTLMFSDDNLFVDRPAARKLLEGLRRLKVRWSCQATIDIANDAPLLESMTRSGCMSVTIGFESLREDSLMQMGKARGQRSADYAAAIARLHAHGLLVYGSFVFGYDGDCAADCDAAARFALQQRLFLANFNPLTPMPGTALHTRLADEGRLHSAAWWLDPSFRYGDLPFEPRACQADALTAGVWQARRRFNSLRGVLTRAMNVRANLRSPRNAAVFLAASWINRREVLRKQGRPLGLCGAPEPQGLVRHAVAIDRAPTEEVASCG